MGIFQVWAKASLSVSANLRHLLPCLLLLEPRVMGKGEVDIREYHSDMGRLAKLAQQR